MNQRIDAIFDNGAFYPQVPVFIPDGSRVTLEVTTPSDAVEDDLSDIQDLLDHEFMQSCRKATAPAVSLEETRKILSKYTGSLSDLISEERAER
jgi:predicted DNA-binding antitoxin AbrB/MazE fold protein